MDFNDTLDWDSDPELKALFEQFIATFSERRARLAPIIEAFQNGLDSVDSRKGLQFEAHKIGGAAATFGFPSLTLLCLEIDDFFKTSPRCTAAELAQMAKFVDEILAASASTRRDPDSFQADARRRLWTPEGSGDEPSSEAFPETSKS